jgi:hypothetical protein
MANRYYGLGAASARAGGSSAPVTYSPTYGDNYFYGASDEELLKQVATMLRDHDAQLVQLLEAR